MKLTIELIPSTSWYTNVRSNVSNKDWNIIRKKCYRLAGNKCEICGEIGEKHKVECHEIWEYDDKNWMQKLVGLIALCPSCHKVKHAGLAEIKGENELIIMQLMKVNEISKEEAIEYIEKSLKNWEKRSHFNWSVDITYIKEYLEDNSSDFIKMESLW